MSDLGEWRKEHIGDIETKHVQILLDRSGSMSTIQKAMEDGFALFLSEQRAIPGAEDIKFALTQFDNLGVDDVEISDLQRANALVLTPRGNTPLYDAVIETIKRATTRMGPKDTMLFVIITDGYENASTHSREEAQRAIAQKMDDGWAFVYLGANQDAWAVGHSIGLRGGTSVNYVPDLAGTTSAYAAVSDTAITYRKYTGARKDLSAEMTIENKDERVKKDDK